MSDDDPLAEQLLDLFVYAPIGLALEAKELIPKLADRGRGQVALTRLAGKVAAQRGGGRGDTVLEQIMGVVGAALGAEPEPPRTPDPGAPEGPEENPIQHYDSLTAAQLLPKLPALSDDELAAVLAYEERHRGRVTVLNRIRQLRR